MWYRIFGGTSTMPTPEALEAFLAARHASVSCHFAADDSGWYRGDLMVDGMAFQLERYLGDEPGIRAELNGWAAWLETREDAAEHVRLMERMIQTAQLFTLHGDEDSRQAETVAIALCRFLAAATEGVYQIDERGFFTAEGALLIAERSIGA
jgi:hypothetical protein